MNRYTISIHRLADIQGEAKVSEAMIECEQDYPGTFSRFVDQLSELMARYQVSSIQAQKPHHDSLQQIRPQSQQDNAER